MHSSKVFIVAKLVENLFNVGLKNIAIKKSNEQTRKCVVIFCNRTKMNQRRNSKKRKNLYPQNFPDLRNLYNIKGWYWTTFETSVPILRTSSSSKIDIQKVFGCVFFNKTILSIRRRSSLWRNLSNVVRNYFKFKMT